MLAALTARHTLKLEELEVIQYSGAFTTLSLMNGNNKRFINFIKIAPGRFELPSEPFCNKMSPKGPMLDRYIPQNNRDYSSTGLYNESAETKSKNYWLIFKFNVLILEFKEDFGI